MRRCQDGDAAAFDTLYRRHCAAVRAICRGRARDTHTVDDLVQETFSRLWAALPTFTGDMVEHWLRRTARNLCIDHQRRRCNAEVPLVAETADRVNAAPDLADPVVTRHAVGAVLAKLRPIDAALLRDHHLADRPLREMAMRWGSTEGSLSVRLTRARRAFAGAGGDLRALLPLPLWFRLRWAARSDSIGTAGTVAAMGAVRVALAVLLVLPPVAASESRGTVTQGSQPGLAQLVTTRESEPPVRSPRQRPGKKHQAERQDSRSRSIQPSDGAASPEPPIAAEVPGTPVRIDGNAPGRPDYRYQVDISHGRDRARAGVGTHQFPSETEAVNKPACDAVAKGPTAVTCSAGSNSSGSEESSDANKSP